MTGSGGLVRSSRPDGAAGHKVRAKRKAANLSQQELATGTGVSRQTVIAMETGDYAPSVYLALRVAKALDATVEELWG